jgi:hypothetical protein
LLNGLNLGLQRSHGHSRFHLPTTTTSYTNLSTAKQRHTWEICFNKETEHKPVSYSKEM